MALSLEAAAEVYREAMREAVRRHALWYLVQGVLLMGVGLLALLYPLIVSTAVVLMLGWFLILAGLVQAVGMIAARKTPHAWLQLAATLLAVLVGFLIITNPGQSLVSITLLILVFFLIEGLARTVFALTIRPFFGWGWLLATGILAILLSIYLVFNAAGVAEWLMALLIGLQFIATGAATAFMAWKVRGAA